MKRIVPIIITIVALGIITIGLLKPRIGNVVETRETENQSLRLRVEMRQERLCFAVCGAYYTFQAAPVGSDNWREIFTVRHDDPNPIPRGNIRFVNPQISYVFFLHKYAVTLDMGTSWTVWDSREANKSLHFEVYALHPSIEDVTLESDGHGEMRLHSITNAPVNQPKLQTSDYGRNWSLH